MKLVVGLGNPGSKYQFNRHNIGFLVVDAFNEVHGPSLFKNESKALVSKIKLASGPVILAKPQTFMNLSGESVRALMDYYGVALADVLIIQDDIDQPFGGLRFHIQRGHGGHNGIRSTHQHLGSDNYARFKIGVGRPSHPGHDVADYVLADFNKSETANLTELLRSSVEAVEYFLENGIANTANKYNGLPALFGEESKGKV